MTRSCAHSWMFAYASSFNADISGWNLASITKIDEALKNATAFNQTLRSDWCNWQSDIDGDDYYGEFACTDAPTLAPTMVPTQAPTTIDCTNVNNSATFEICISNQEPLVNVTGNFNISTQVDIESSVKIIGNGFTITGTPSELRIVSTGIVSMEYLIWSNVGINNEGTITIMNGCTFNENNNILYGIYNSINGTIGSIQNCTFEDNRGSFVGGIQNSGTMTSIQNCRFTNNTGPVVGGILNVGTISSIQECTFEDNSGSFVGGILNVGTMTSIQECTFEDNSADLINISDIVNLDLETASTSFQILNPTQNGTMYLQENDFNGDNEYWIVDLVQGDDGIQGCDNEFSTVNKSFEGTFDGAFAFVEGQEIQTELKAECPTPLPTHAPTSDPTHAPTSSPTTSAPTSSPTTSAPTSFPTAAPTTSAPTHAPTSAPTSSPTTSSPTTSSPTSSPSMAPTPTPCVPQQYNTTGLKHAVEFWIADQPTAEANYCHISTWDTSDVTSMNSLFMNRNTFNGDISGWDVGNVENME